MSLISHYFGRDTHIQNHRAMRLSVGTLKTFLMQYKNKKIIEKYVTLKGLNPNLLIRSQVLYPVKLRAICFYIVKFEHLNHKVQDLLEIL